MTMTMPRSNVDVFEVLEREAMKNDSYCCSLSLVEIQDRSGYSFSGVRMAINLLCAAGCIEKVQYAEDGKRLKKNRYILLKRRGF